MLLKDYLEKYEKLVIQDENKLFYSDGKSQIGGVFKKGQGML